jgi:ligand-binding sensor domain-containing protein
MGRLYLIFVAFLLGFWSRSLAAEWINYTCGNHISVIVHHGDSIWTGTWGGLALINRKTDEVSLLNKTNLKLADNEITGLAVDSNGAIFIGSRWLQKFDKNAWKTYISINSDQNDWVYCIAIDKNNNIYIGDGLCLREFNGMAWDSVQLGSIFLAHFRISSIEFDKQGNTLVGTSQGLYVLKNMIIVKNISSTGEINSVLADTNGSLWVGTNAKGLMKLDNTTWDVIDSVDTAITGPHISCMSFDSQKNLWVGASNGLLMFDGKKWTVYNSASSKIFDGANLKKYTTSNSGLYDNWLHSIAIDGKGTVWVFDGACILRFDGLRWTSYDTSSTKFFDSLFTRIYEDSTQKIWAGADVAFVLEYKIPWYFYTYNIWKMNRSGKIKRDKNGIIWMARNNGLWRYDGSQWKVYNKSNSSMPANDVGRVMISDDNQVWFTSNNDNILMSFNGQQWRTIYTCSSNYWISSIALDRNANPWVGLADIYTIGKEYGGGVARYDGQKWESFTISNSGLPSNSVTELEFDSTGNLWVGAYGGMAKFDGKNVWTAYTIQNSGLPDNSVEQIEIDLLGNKWIKTQFGGLAVFREGGVVLQTKINNSPRNPSEKFRKNDVIASISDSFLNLSIEKGCDLEVKIFDLSGKQIGKIPKKWFNKGNFHILLPGRSCLPNGICLIAIQAGSLQILKKINLLR